MPLCSCFLTRGGVGDRFCYLVWARLGVEVYRNAEEESMGLGASPRATEINGSGEGSDTSDLNG